MGGWKLAGSIRAVWSKLRAVANTPSANVPHDALLTNQHLEQLQILAQGLYMQDVRVLIDWICTGQFVEDLATNKASFECLRPDSRNGKDKRYRDKRNAEKQASADAENVGASDESSDNATPIPPKPSPPKDRRGTTKKTEQRRRSDQERYEVELASWQAACQASAGRTPGAYSANSHNESGIPQPDGSTTTGTHLRNTCNANANIAVGATLVTDRAPQSTDANANQGTCGCSAHVHADSHAHAHSNSNSAAAGDTSTDESTNAAIITVCGSQVGVINPSKGGRKRLLDNAAVSARTARRRKAESLAKGGTAGDIVQRPRAPQEGIRNLKKRTRETFRTLLVESSELAAHASKEVEAGDTDAMLRMLLSSGGRDSKLVTNIKDALPAHILDQLRKEGEDMFKARLREPTRVQEAMLKANMSHDSYEAFWSNLVPNEKGVKAGR